MSSEPALTPEQRVMLDELSSGRAWNGAMLNLHALARTIQDDGTIPRFVTPVEHRHLIQCIETKLLVAENGVMRITPLGRAALSVLITRLS